MDKQLSVGGEPVFLLVLHAEPSLEHGADTPSPIGDDYLLDGELGMLDTRPIYHGHGRDRVSFDEVAELTPSSLERAVASATHKAYEGAAKHAYAACSPLRLYAYVRAEVNEDDVEDVRISKALVTAGSPQEAKALGYRALPDVPHGYVSTDEAIDIDDAIRAVDVQPEQNYNVIAIPRH